MELLYIFILLVEVAAILAGTNVALDKEAKISSVNKHYPNAVADKAVDGNLNQNHVPGGMCFHTNKRRTNWWYVDLEEKHTIQNITIFNRQDCCADRARQIKVTVGNCLDVMKEVAFIEKMGSVETIILPENTIGRFVRLVQRIPEGEELHLCEIQVFSDD